MSALHYLMNPLQKEKFFQVMDRSLGLLRVDSIVERLDEALSLRETLALNYRAFRLLGKRCPGVYLLYFISSVTDAASPYFTTAALDPIAEMEIYQQFDQIARDKTAIYISHRLSSCRFCDEIAVFEEGRFIQQGAHDTLLQEKDGLYHRLWNAQAQYYRK